MRSPVLVGENNTPSSSIIWWRPPRFTFPMKNSPDGGETSAPATSTLAGIIATVGGDLDGSDLECGGKRSATPLWIVRSSAFRRPHGELESAGDETPNQSRRRFTLQNPLTALTATRYDAYGS